MHYCNAAFVCKVEKVLSIISLVTVHIQISQITKYDGMKSINLYSLKEPYSTSIRHAFVYFYILYFLSNAR